MKLTRLALDDFTQKFSRKEIEQKVYGNVDPKRGTVHVEVEHVL